MALNESDLIGSLLRGQAYLEQITTEMVPDDTLDLLKGTRRGKSEVKQLDHIVGISDLLSRQKAQAQKQRAVTLTKKAQLQRCLIALGVFLRKYFMENIERDDLAVETQFFGKFSLAADPDADPESLYPHKIVYEATGLMAQINTYQQQENTQAPKLTRQLDFTRLARLCRVGNTSIAKRNLESLGNHLVTMAMGQTSGEGSDSLQGKTLKVNLRIGSLIVRKGSVTFEPLSLQQILQDSQDQSDDLMSKTSSMSRMSLAGQRYRKSSLSQVKADTQSVSFYSSVDSQAGARQKVPDLIQSRGRQFVLENSIPGLSVTVNPITGHTQHFKKEFLGQFKRKSVVPGVGVGSPVSGADKETFVDFAPVELGDINLNAMVSKYRKKGQMAQDIYARSKIKDNKGIAALIASQVDLLKQGNVDVDKKYNDLLSNFDTRSRTSALYKDYGGVNHTGVNSAERIPQFSQKNGGLMGSPDGPQSHRSMSMLQSHRSNATPMQQRKIGKSNQLLPSLYQAPALNSSRHSSVGGSQLQDREENLYSNRYKTSQSALSVTHCAPKNAKILSNLPSGKYIELKDEQMMPDEQQQRVQNQALTRMQQRLHELETSNVKTHNSMIQNLMAMEHHTSLQQEQKRRMNIQNQKYLRLQMKQKQENERFDHSEKFKYQAQFEHTAPGETEEHNKKVSFVSNNRQKADQINQINQREAEKALKVLVQSNERQTQQVYDKSSYQMMEDEKKMTSDRKKNMQAINKQVWKDQIELNRMHKKLNL